MVPVETFRKFRRTLAYWGIAIPGSSRRCQAFILLGRDVLRDTSYSFDRAHVHLNLVDMTARCAAKRPVLETHGAVEMLRIFVLDWHIEQRISGMVGGNMGFSISDTCAPDDPVRRFI